MIHQLQTIYEINSNITMIKRRNQQIHTQDQHPIVARPQSYTTIKPQQKYNYNLEQALNQQTDNHECASQIHREIYNMNTFRILEPQSKPQPQINKRVIYHQSNQNEQKSFIISKNNKSQDKISSDLKYQNKLQQQNTSFKHYASKKQNVNHNISLQFNELNESQDLYQPEQEKGGKSYRQHIIREEQQSDLEYRYNDTWTNNQRLRNKQKTNIQKDQNLNARLKNIARENTNKIINSRPSKQILFTKIQRQKSRPYYQPTPDFFPTNQKNKIIQSHPHFFKQRNLPISKDKSASHNKTKPTSPQRRHSALNTNSQITTLKSSPNRQVSTNTIISPNTILQISQIDKFLQRLNSRMQTATNFLQRLKQTRK